MGKPRRHKVECIVCGQVKLSVNKTKTCGYECRERLRRARRLESSETGPCPACGETAPLQFKAYDYRVCSVKCRHLVFARKRRLAPGYRYEGATTKLVSTDPIACAHCGTTFTPDRHNARFCSTKCRDGFYSREPNTRARRLERAKVKREEKNKRIRSCALCGTKEKHILTPDQLGGKYGAGSKFHSDHIVARSNGGESNGDNLRFVCWFCNQAKRDIDNAYDSAVASASRAFWREIRKQ